MSTYCYRLPFPPSVNTAWRHTGRVTYLTKPQREFRTAVWRTIHEVGPPHSLAGRLAVGIELIAPNKRKYDIDGRIKAVLDALEQAGAFWNDEQVDHLDVKRLHIEPPGACDVTIVQLND